MTENQKLREALRRIKHEAASLADAQVIALEALSLPTQAEPVEGGEARTFRAALMGHGRVAIGQCKDQINGTPGIVYLDMGGEQRTIDADTSDLFEPGSVADESKVLACIYFATPDAVRQSIAVLHELLADQFGDTSQPASQEHAREHFMAGYAAAEEDAAVCQVPPLGWHCTRKAGHDGPCAAVPTDDAELVQRGMDRLRAASQDHAEPAAQDHIPDTGKMIETAAPVGDRLTLSDEDVHAAFVKHFPKTRISQAWIGFAAEIAEAIGARAALSAGDAVDAKRYRWLREQHWSNSDICCVDEPKQNVRLGGTCPSGDLLDSAIDAAMRKDKP